VFLLVPAHPGSPGKRAVKWLLLFCVVVKKWNSDMTEKPIGWNIELRTVRFGYWNLFHDAEDDAVIWLESIATVALKK